MRLLLGTLAATALLATTAVSSEAHYFWVQPQQYTVGSGAQATVQLFVGHGTDLKEYPHVTPAFKRFVAIGPKRTAKVVGKLGATPAGKVTLDHVGVHTVVYDSHHSFVRLDAPKFEKYLHEKGLAHVLAERARRGESKREGRESYARCAKALIQVGKARRGFDRRVKLPLELTPLDNPFRAKRKVRFVLEFRGQPLSNSLVELVPLHASDKSAVASARTDAKGQVRFRIPKSGQWMVSSVHMRRAKKPISGDWESFWANTTFAAR